MSAPRRVALLGASGRMGASLLRCLPEFPGLALGAALVRPGNPRAGEDAGCAAGLAPVGVVLGTDLGQALAGADVVIDFSSAAMAGAHLRACVAAGKPLVLGTTGLAASLEGELARAAERIPLLASANTSLGVALLAELVRQAAAALPESFDIEIVEAHHRGKVDSPSGTALVLGAAAARGRGRRIDPEPATRGPRDPGPRPCGQVGYASVRGGDVVGEHDVLFLGNGERLRLGHSATDRAVFARGALAAAAWLAGQGPGRYQMRDLFAQK